MVHCGRWHTAVTLFVATPARFTVGLFGREGLPSLCIRCGGGTGYLRVSAARRAGRYWLLFAAERFLFFLFLAFSFLVCF